IDENGLLVTSYHVISGSESEITLILSNGLEFEGKMVRKSKNADVALIQINAPEVTTPLKISQNQPKVGSEIYLIGTPSASDLGQTISKGIISGIRKSQTANYVQTDASINTGNSGGPMIDKNGNVIGVVNSKLSGISTEGLGFVTPSNLVIESLNLQYSE
ncbi:MAG: trypsin-like peptidase domain-containing protein, partial [Ekhidna sp.]